MIFDGNEFARGLTKELRLKVIKLKKTPVLATIYNPEDKASRVYTEIKAAKANELGIDFRKLSIINYQLPISDLIIQLNSDENIDGVMIQTPLFKERESGRVEEQELCELIDPKKDVDGLNSESGVIPATVRAILKIYDLAQGGRKVVVVGQRGLVGKNVISQLSKDPNFWVTGMSASELDVEVLKNAEAIISATGREGLIKSEMIKSGAVCIDVGYPKGDFDPSVALRASFFTPVPGGVGPVTVVCLFENLVELIYG